jgi:hypothetical protein
MPGASGLLARTRLSVDVDAGSVEKPAGNILIHRMDSFAGTGRAVPRHGHLIHG